MGNVMRTWLTLHLLQQKQAQATLNQVGIFADTVYTRIPLTFA